MTIRTEERRRRFRSTDLPGFELRDGLVCSNFAFKGFRRKSCIHYPILYPRNRHTAQFFRVIAAFQLGWKNMPFLPSHALAFVGSIGFHRLRSYRHVQSGLPVWIMRGLSAPHSGRWQFGNLYVRHRKCTDVSLIPLKVPVPA